MWFLQLKVEINLVGLSLSDFCWIEILPFAYHHSECNFLWLTRSKQNVGKCIKHGQSAYSHIWAFSVAVQYHWHLFCCFLMCYWAYFTLKVLLKRPLLSHFGWIQMLVQNLSFSNFWFHIFEFQYIQNRQSFIFKCCFNDLYALLGLISSHSTFDHAHWAFHKSTKKMTVRLFYGCVCASD